MTQQIEAVQRMQDYIEQNLAGEITPADLARAALFSPWYAYRLFRRHTGLTPADYIRRLRLSRSALRLRDEGKPMPACIIAMSPWADLTLSGSSYNNNVRLDPITEPR